MEIIMTAMYVLPCVFVGALYSLAGALTPKQTVGFCDLKMSIVHRRLIGWTGFLLGMSIFWGSFFYLDFVAKTIKGGF